VALRLARLDAPERAPVAGDGDAAAHGDAEGIERAVVLNEAVVDVDDLRGYIPVPGVGVERRHLGAATRRVDRERRLVERERFRGRGWARDHPGRHTVGVREVDGVFLAPRLEPPRAQALEDVVAGRRLRRGAGDVGRARQLVGQAARTRRVGDGEEPLLERVRLGRHAWGRGSEPDDAHGGQMKQAGSHLGRSD
jgi:hypothetical protein